MARLGPSTGGLRAPNVRQALPGFAMGSRPAPAAESTHVSKRIEGLECRSPWYVDSRGGGRGAGRGVLWDFVSRAGDFVAEESEEDLGGSAKLVPGRGYWRLETKDFTSCIVRIGALGALIWIPPPLKRGLSKS
ncbi:hypothetical protein DYB38_007065 [Aphanomyces astaci]|uniref:Uncharacterized protein n=1 Tax=Aphanomyces astaci TaxID=112090 RepID=A0A397DLC4_APHAT|nr:hypothetical protein DYB38_007065 [Aphanomyces astaci]